MKKLLGAVAAVSLLVGASAYAEGGGGVGGSGSSTQQQQQHGQSGQMGGSGQMGQAGQGQNQITGKVLKADRSSVTIEYQGAAVPFTVSSDTSFQGVRSARDLKEGQQVRASFELSNNRNELKSISVVGAGSQGQGSEGSGAGGSGSTGSGSSGSDSQGGSGSSSDQPFGGSGSSDDKGY